MSKQRSKRFQSGKEIFRTYVPGFPDEEHQSEMGNLDPSSEGAELARTLLDQFGANLSSKINSKPKKKRSSVPA